MRQCRTVILTDTFSHDVQSLSQTQTVRHTAQEEPGTRNMDVHNETGEAVKQTKHIRKWGI